MTFFRFARNVTRVALWPFFRVSYHGTQNIPSGGGYILAPNHRFALDPLFVSYRVPVDISYMAKAELFENKLLKLLFDGLGAFPVSRGKADNSAMETAAKKVKEGIVLGIFPEGTRSKDGALGIVKSGVMVVAATTGAPILPVAIKIDRPGLFCKVDITYGKPISCEELGLTGEVTPSALRGGRSMLSNWYKETLQIND